MDLRDLWRGGLSYRRLFVLLRCLPEDSRTQTLLRDESFRELAEPSSGPPKFGPWALINYQLAQLIDAVNRNTYTNAVGLRLQDPRPPEPTPRPGLNRRVRKQSAAAVAYLKKLRGKAD